MNTTLDIIKSQYYHEIQARDQITTKIQSSVALYLSFFVAVAYMTRMIDLESNKIVLTLFFTGLFFWMIFILIATCYTANSITGFKYRVFPSLTEILNYKNSLDNEKKIIFEYNIDVPDDEKIPNIDPSEIIDNETIEYLSECADHNYNINETRRVGYTKSMGFLISSIIPFLFSSLLFIGFDLDASSPRKENPNQGTEIAKEIKAISPFIEKISRNNQASEVSK